MRQRGFHRRGELREDREIFFEDISFFEEYDAGLEVFAKRCKIRLILEKVNVTIHMNEDWSNKKEQKFSEESFNVTR